MSGKKSSAVTIGTTKWSAAKSRRIAPSTLRSASRFAGRALSAVACSSIGRVLAILDALSSAVNRLHDFRMRLPGESIGAPERKFFFSAIAQFSAGTMVARRDGQMMSERVRETSDLRSEGPRDETY